MTKVKPRFVVLFICAMIAIGSLPIIYVNALKSADRIKWLQAKCEQEAITQMMPASCIKPAIKYGSGKLTETQLEILYTNSGEDWLSQWAQVVMACAIFSAVPFVWLFLLARLRELSRAIRGLD